MLDFSYYYNYQSVVSHSKLWIVEATAINKAITKHETKQNKQFRVSVIDFLWVMGVTCQAMRNIFSVS